MAASNAQGIDALISSTLSETDGLLTAPAAPKKKTLSLPDKTGLKAKPGPYDDYVSGVLGDVDKLLAPPKAPPKSDVAPEGGPVDSLIGGVEGAWNTVKGMVTGVAGQAAGLLDIPLHASGMSKTDPESVERAVSGVGDLTPGTRRGERTSQAVQEGAGDILGAGGRAVSLAARIAGKAPAGPDTSFGTGFQSRFGIPVPGVTQANPEGVVSQSPEEQAKIEGVVNSALLPVLGGKPEATPRAMVEEPPEPAPTPDGNNRGAYTPPEVKENEAPKAEKPAAEVRRETAAPAAAADKLRLPANWNTAKLPNHLKGAKPGYGPDNPLKFESDVEKALYIVGNPKTKSRMHDDYMDWLQKTLGTDEAGVMKLARASRERTIGIAKTGKSDIPAYVRTSQRQAPASPAPAERAQPAPTEAPSAKVVDMEGARDRRESPPDLSRQFAGTQTASHTPYPEGTPPQDFVMGKIRLKEGDRDVVVPVKTEFEDPGDGPLFKIGDAVLQQFGDSKEPRLNTADPAQAEVLRQMRQYLQHYDPQWVQNDMRANLSYARAFAREVRDLHQRGYNVLRDHLEENFPDNPKGELRANPHKYAFTTKVPRWTPRDLVTKCF